MIASAGLEGEQKLHHFTEPSGGVTVRQKRPEIITGSESETLHCEHDDATHLTMFWYVLKHLHAPTSLYEYFEKEWRQGIDQRKRSGRPHHIHITLDKMELLYVFVALLFSTKSSGGVTVLQKRPEIITGTGSESETLHCEHDDANHDYMF
ncbi:hypothetical protein SKAU_G00332090 [Synaphobranchus kaupii]|uniref:Uncharacterized protein n=1 Tax=Synaphobranchus kaupii TaxID=118154 RepID=A0A9Q1IGE2_SYNKA|nr:hypothetical protein SKAU_G00332090 [Synaphobranchus kaupii]